MPITDTHADKAYRAAGELLDLLKRFVATMDREPGNVTPTQRCEALAPIADEARKLLASWGKNPLSRQ